MPTAPTASAHPSGDNRFKLLDRVVNKHQWRGTLFHQYRVDGNGVLQKVNLVIATAQNNLAMTRTVHQLAMQYLDGTKLTEGLLNRMEAGIRCFDPCLSCSTHAVGVMPLHVQILDADGCLANECQR